MRTAKLALHVQCGLCVLPQPYFLELTLVENAGWPWLVLVRGRRYVDHLGAHDLVSFRSREAFWPNLTLWTAPGLGWSRFCGRHRLWVFIELPLPPNPPHQS